MDCRYFTNITMKGGLSIIYTSLLTISVLSSCVLLILVSLQVNGEVNRNVDLSGLHNVSQKSVEHEDSTITSSPEAKDDVQPAVGDPKPVFDDNEMTFAETLSLNSVTTDGLPDTGQPPILVSLVDNAKLELKTPDELLFTNDSEQHNDTKTFTIVDSKDDSNEAKDKSVSTESSTSEQRLIVKAKPMHETRLAEEAFQTTTPLTIEVDSTTESHIEELSEQDKENIPVKPVTPQEDIPSFSEWAQKQLAEAEKKDTVLNHSTQPSHSNTNFSSKSTKVRSKNYASLVCGSKIVAVNPEAGSASSILSPNRDEYMLNTCNSRIWFVVELCEAVQAQKIEIANFELFSSTPKDFVVYFSDRFPTREWTSVGQFTAKDIRDVQSFDLYPHLFGKFIKVELLSHHGSEHYCPVSLFKVYGTSEFEVLEKESSQHTAHVDEDEDDEIIDVPDVPAAEIEPSKNLFGSARDAVMSIMKKAAQALVKTEVPKNVSSEHNDTSSDEMYKRCCTPSHIIVCDNCSETLYHEVYELISCSSDKLTSLVRQVFLRETLKCTGICQPFGLDFKSTKTIEFSEERVAYFHALFPTKYLAALCNMLAIKEKKVVLNTSYETEQNVTSAVTIDDIPLVIDSETASDNGVKIVDKTNTATDDEKINETHKEDATVIEPKNEAEVIIIDMQKDEKEKTDSNKREETLPVIDENTSQEQIEDTGKVISETEKPLETKLESEEKDSTRLDPKNGKLETVQEKAREGIVNVIEEGNANDQMVIDNDSFMSDFDQMAVDPTPSGQTTQNQNQGSPQKESVFLRLSNRVKTLERNMSLSGQYLEELSRRYKKQVEEMQKTFEKTVLQMTEEKRKSMEREQKYVEQMSNLQVQLGHMTAAVSTLMDERDSWFGNITFFKFIIFQSIILGAVLYYMSHKRPAPKPIMVPIPKKTKKKQDKFRRKSVEGVSGHGTPATKKRRPSEEALQIARKAVEEVDEDDGEWQLAKKNRRRKTSILHRNLEIDRPNWTRQDSIGKLQENPIPLDEEEFFAPVSEPTEFNENGPPPPKKELLKSNGSFFNTLKSKTIKTRRLSSPAFLRTLSSRSTPSPVVKRSPGALFNGKTSKAASESPTGSLWSESTELSQNGQLTENGGKKKKSLKNILKKVF